MRERNSDYGNGSLDLLLRRAEDPSIDRSRCLNRIGTGVEVDRSQEGVDEGAEASPAWPVEVAALNHLYMNRGVSSCVGDLLRSRSGGDGLAGAGHRASRLKVRKAHLDSFALVARLV
jgi:hypothetical protein